MASDIAPEPNNSAHETEKATDPEPEFRPPEEIAAADNPTKGSTEDPTKPKKWWQWRPTKDEAIVIGAVAAVIAGGAVIFALTRAARAPATVKHATLTITPNKPASTTVPSTLTGLPVDPSVNERPVTGVMIENSTAARPQSGLDQAGVVFEALAEGGVTRFLALYQDTQPSYIGPVRSVRPYYLQWCLGFDCAIAHVGGSPDALSDISSWDVKNLDQFYNASAYERISSRVAPHNVYTSIAQLNTLEASKGFGASHYSGFARKSAQPVKTPTATSIDFSLSSAAYNVHYDYDAKTNSYARSEGGQPHMEINQAGAQTQITPKVVIAMVVPESRGALDSSGAYYTDYAVIGSGQVYVFQDGGVTVGTWQKTSNTAQIVFTASNGQTLKLDSGQTWITVVGSASDVSYKP